MNMKTRVPSLRKLLFSATIFNFPLFSVAFTVFRHCLSVSSNAFMVSFFHCVSTAKRGTTLTVNANKVTL